MSKPITISLDVMDAILWKQIRPCMWCSRRFATHMNSLTWDLRCDKCFDIGDPDEVPLMNEGYLRLALQANRAIDEAREGEK